MWKRSPTRVERYTSRKEYGKMEELVRAIALSLVEHPDAVEVKTLDGEEGGIIIELHVAPEDMGKVIGKQGRIAKALRVVVKAVAARENKKVSVEIMQ
jgi:predicted RNA-binding protein YlqC (UPF0109 family)